MEAETGILNYILWVEDDPHDVELTRTALDEHHMANKSLAIPVGHKAEPL
jgi:hypothetical protein